MHDLYDAMSFLLVVGWVCAQVASQQKLSVIHSNLTSLDTFISTSSDLDWISFDDGCLHCSYIHTIGCSMLEDCHCTWNLVHGLGHSCFDVLVPIHSILWPHVCTLESGFASSAFNNLQPCFATSWECRHTLLWQAFAGPAGLYFCMKCFNEEHLLLIVYALTTIYLSGIMIHLIPIATPAFVMLGAITVSEVLVSCTRQIRIQPISQKTMSKQAKKFVRWVCT